MGRRSDHSRPELRALAIRAAQQLLVDGGLDGLKVRPLAAAIGYAPGTLYNLFGNLDDLILEINASTLERLRGRVEAAAAPETDPEAALLAMARAYIAEVRENPGLWSAVFEHRIGEGRPLPDWYQAQVARVFEPVESGLAPLFEAEDGPACRRAARVLWSSLHGMTSLFPAGKLGTVSALSAEDMAEDLIKHYLRGLRRAP